MLEHAWMHKRRVQSTPGSDKEIGTTRLLIENRWSEAQGEVMSEVNGRGRGNTKKIYEVLNALKGKS